MQVAKHHHRVIELPFVILNVRVERETASALATQPKDIEVLGVHLLNLSWQLMDLKSTAMLCHFIRASQCIFYTEADPIKFINQQ